MSETLSFEDILALPASEIDRPLPVPAGTYTAIVRGMPEYGESQQKKTPYARFVLELIACDDDTDPELWQGKTLRRDIWLTKDSLWRAKQFGEHCGVDVTGMTLQQVLEACSGAQLLVTVRHRPDQSGDGIFAEITKTAELI